VVLKKHTMAQLFAAWLADVRERVDRGERSEGTFRQYESYVREHMAPALGHIDCRRLTVTDVESYVGSLRLAPKTRANHRAAVRRSLNLGLKLGWMEPPNVAGLSDPIPDHPRRVPALSVADAQALLDSLRGDPLYSAFVTAVFSGLRAAEICGLRVEAVNLDAGTARIHQQVQPVKGQGLVLTRLKSHASTATIDLVPEVVTVLADTIGDRTSGFVWESAPGRPYWPTSITHGLTRALKRAGRPHLTVHMLRHLFCSFWPGLQVAPAVAQRLARHSDFGVTMNVYTSVEDGLKRQAMERLHEKIQNATGSRVGLPDGLELQRAS